MFQPIYRKIDDNILSDELFWSNLSRNPTAIYFLEQNMDRIEWDDLSLNPNAITLLEDNFDKIYWDGLSRNPNAIELLEANLDKIDWYYICLNPNAFKLNRLSMMNKCEPFAKELAIHTCHPEWLVSIGRKYYNFGPVTDSEVLYHMVDKYDVERHMIDVY